VPDEPSTPEDLPEVQPLDLSNLDDTLRSTLWSWVESTVALLPNIVLALLVLGLTWLIARLVSTLTRNALQRFSANQQLTHLASVATRVAVLGAGLFASLAILGLNGVVASLLAGVGVVGLALGFAFQDIAANFMSSILLAASRPYRVGDLIRTTAFFGVVERTDLRVTRLRTLDGELVLIPNKDVYNNPLVNLTETPDLRVEVALGVGYDDDLRAARDATHDALESLPMRNADKPVQVFFTGFGSSSIDFVARFWIHARSQADVLEARSEAIIAVKDAIDAAGLHIPFPIRTLDFGATPVGGERLDTVLRPVFARGES
jgi:small conductance mechanosensitive channel